jgi:hypothetical protein
MFEAQTCVLEVEIEAEHKFLPHLFNIDNFNAPTKEQVDI